MYPGAMVDAREEVRRRRATTPKISPQIPRQVRSVRLFPRALRLRLANTPPPRAPPASTPGGDGRPQRAIARARAERAARAPPQAREQAPGARRDAIASPVAASPASAPRRASSSSRARRTKRKRSERRRRRRRRSPSPSPALRDRTRKRARSRGITSTPRTARTSRPCGRRSRRSSSSADRAAGRARARSVITLHWSPYDRVGVVNAVS